MSNSLIFKPQEQRKNIASQAKLNSIKVKHRHFKAKVKKNNSIEKADLNKLKIAKKILYS